MGDGRGRGWRGGHGAWCWSHRRLGHTHGRRGLVGTGKHAGRSPGGGNAFGPSLRRARRWGLPHACIGAGITPGGGGPARRGRYRAGDDRRLAGRGRACRSTPASRPLLLGRRQFQSRGQGPNRCGSGRIQAHRRRGRGPVRDAGLSHGGHGGSRNSRPARNRLRTWWRGDRRGRPSGLCARLSAVLGRLGGRSRRHARPIRIHDDSRPRNVEALTFWTVKFVSLLSC